MHEMGHVCGGLAVNDLKGSTMKKQLQTAFCILTCTIALNGTAMATNPYLPKFDPQPDLRFTVKSVTGKSMVSSGYPNGTMTFNSNGSLTCTNYPVFIGCKSWQIQSDGTLIRKFTDSHTGIGMEVEATWKLLSRSGNTLQVQQTSSNSGGGSVITVTIQ